MQAQLPHYITPEEYLEGEKISQVKHEYFDGRVYAMAGGTNAHAVICTNASIILGAQLRGKTCRVVGGEQRVKIEATGLHVYPDASVCCEGARFDGAGVSQENYPLRSGLVGFAKIGRGDGVAAKTGNVEKSTPKKWR